MKNVLTFFQCLGGDEISEYAETVKTIDSMDSTTVHKYSHDPNPQRFSYSTQSTIHNGSHPLREKDRFPMPMKQRAVQERANTPQTTV